MMIIVDKRQVYILATMISYLLAIFLVVESESAGIKSIEFSKEIATTASARKLLESTNDNNGDKNRIGKSCSKDDIVISQGSTASLPDGTPSFIVQILNVGVSGSSISDIHVSCGWFSSVQLINPRVFRRIIFNDCLVNGGDALAPGETISFKYANSFRYPLSVTSAVCD
ncbi:hypothetical protein JCGZ_19394 [Jatropha curcas]|uniref:Uncharacterized protein n=1 Tax=Jatropha curcas TaxID=180498 RepID=A0A067JZA7_JATCU|nr:TPD1 protein homolog 1-like [Jatropha curcas]KDP29291.1 hypothetical protein JCGZ_19394 [Jatropha curcas]